MPQRTPPHTPWEHPQVQKAYEVLLSNEEPPANSHWEGWVARRVADAMGWRPINEAPFQIDETSRAQWLPECLLLVNGVAVQGMCSGGQWLTRSLQAPDSWEDLPVRPTFWQPLAAIPHSGHGWVFLNKSGVVVKCGGPAICTKCQTDLTTAGISLAQYKQGVKARTA